MALEAERGCFDLVFMGNIRSAADALLHLLQTACGRSLNARGEASQMNSTTGCTDVDGVPVVDVIGKPCWLRKRSCVHAEAVARPPILTDSIFPQVTRIIAKGRCPAVPRATGTVIDALNGRALFGADGQSL